MSLGTSPDHIVETKVEWEGAWTQQPRLECLRARTCVAPERSEAVFKWLYGSIAYPTHDFTGVAPLEIGDYYVRVSFDGEEWIGVIAQEAFNIFANLEADPTGLEPIVAYGLDQTLDGDPLTEAVVDLGGGSRDKVDFLPTFNVRHSKGGTLLGNRSGSKIDGAYTFGGTDVWSVKDILEALLAHYHYPSDPPFVLGGLASDLDQIYPVVDLYGLTIRQAVEKLIDRRRGYSWRIIAGSGGIGNNTLSIVSQFKTTVNVGEAAPYEAAFAPNPTQASIDARTSEWIESCVVRREYASECDEVRVEGARIKSVFSVAGGNNTLAAGWHADHETAYLAGASGAADYAGLALSEQAYRNGLVRADDRFDRVFRFFRVELASEYKAGPGTTLYRMNPPTDYRGELLAGSAEMLAIDHPLLPTTVLEEGIDYTDSELPQTLPTGGQSRFRKPFVLVKDDQDRYHYADQLSDVGIPNARVEMADREMGVLVEFRPAHLLARNHWTGAEPDEWEPVFDYEDVIATICMETDERLVVVETAAVSQAEWWRRILITIPDAELWFVARDTVVGVDEDGALEVTPQEFELRNDADRLRVIAKLAAQWYGTPHRAIDLVENRVRNIAEPGSLILNVLGGDALTLECNSLVTLQQWDFENGKTVLQSGWYAVDWRRVAPANRPGLPSLKHLALQTERADSGLDAWRQWEAD